MNDVTANLRLPYLSESQAQKEVVYNEMLNILQMLVQSCVVDIADTPPTSPLEGDLYIIGSSPTGVWSGCANNLTCYIGGNWKYLVPKEGWQVWNTSDSKEYRYLSGAWT